MMPATLEITDITGRVLTTRTLPAILSQAIEINCSALKRGIYWVRLHAGGHYTGKGFIKD
jgi:hypothetical protein